MDIDTRINKAMADYTTKTGLEVCSIYLGRSQMRELIQWAKYIYRGDGWDADGMSRAKYNGALVYMVNDYDHLNVS